MKLEFPSAPKNFKKVKNVKVYLAQKNGVDTEYDLPIWMEPAGTPTFCVPVPPEFDQAWAAHRTKNYRAFDSHISTRDGWLHAASFNEAIERLKKLSDNYAEHIKSLNIRKVIEVYLELSSPDDQIRVNQVSFSSARISVGLRTKVYWEVNGHVYLDRRRKMKFDDTDDSDAAMAEPTYEELEPAGYREGRGVLVPYSDAAWSTIQQVEATLRRAAVMLQTLAKPEDTQRLLEAGMAGLLEYKP